MGREHVVAEAAQVMFKCVYLLFHVDANVFPFNFIHVSDSSSVNHQGEPTHQRLVYSIFQSESDGDALGPTVNPRVDVCLSTLLPLLPPPLPRDSCDRRAAADPHFRTTFGHQYFVTDTAPVQTPNPASRWRHMIVKTKTYR